jgi:hypothetical protein
MCLTRLDIGKTRGIRGFTGCEFVAPASRREAPGIIRKTGEELVVLAAGARMPARQPPGTAALRRFIDERQCY